MSEYIKREDAVKVIKNYGKGAISDGLATLDPVDDIVALANAMDWLSTEDVEPAKHGRWAEVKKRTVIYPDNCLEQLEVLGFLHRTEQQLQCSLCRKVTMVDDTIAYSYCPHCGAKMDEVSE